MSSYSQTKVWNFDLPPYPREGIFHLDMSEHCQVNRLLKFEAGRLAQIHQLDVIHDMTELRRFQKSLRRKIWDKLGVVYDGTLPLDVTEYGTLRKKGFTIRKLIYQSRPGLYVTALLYVPDGKGPFPAVLQMHGHNPEGKFGENPQRMSMALALSGYVCLTVDAFGVYERAPECYRRQGHGNVLGAALFNIGESLMGEQIVDNMRGVDLLRSLPYVKKDRIGATGASGGGNQTMWLSAMDERVTAAMPIVSVGSFASYVYGLNCLCELLPDGLAMTEETGVLALIAPRHLRIGNALYDCNHDFSVSEMLKTYHAVERVYWNLGIPEKISFNVADRVHGLTDRQRESVLGFFAFALKGEGSGNALPEPETEVFPEKELYLFKKPADRPHTVRTIPEHLKLMGDELRKEFLARKKFDAAASRAELRKILRLNTALPQLVLHRYAEVNGTGRAAVEAGNHLVPFLVRPGKKAGKFRIVLHPQGKSYLDEKTLREAEADGATLILPDLFGTGETAQPNHTCGLHHQFYRQLLWIGRSLIGEWVFDILVLVKMLRQSFGAKNIELEGLLETGAAAVFANVFSDGVDSVSAVDTPASLLFDDSTISLESESPFVKFLPHAIYSLMLAMPGFLRWGDISLAVALGHGKTSFISPRTFDGTMLSASQQTAFLKEMRDVSKRLN